MGNCCTTHLVAEIDTGLEKAGGSFISVTSLPVDTSSRCGRCNTIASYCVYKIPAEDKVNPKSKKN